jgi:hypothetical protein
MEENTKAEEKQGMVKCNVVEQRRTPTEEEKKSEDDLTKQAEEIFKKD